MSAEKVIRLNRGTDSTLMLQESIGMDFDEVVIVGKRGGQVFTTASASLTRLETLGALESAKMHVWEQWD